MQLRHLKSVGRETIKGFPERLPLGQREDGAVNGTHLKGAGVLPEGGSPIALGQVL